MQVKTRIKTGFIMAIWKALCSNNGGNDGGGSSVTGVRG